MFHKRKVDLSTLGEPDQKRFRHNVSNLFLTKTVSARRANELMKDAQIAGATGVKDLVKCAEKSGSGEKQANWEKNWQGIWKEKCWRIACGSMNTLHWSLATILEHKQKRRRYLFFCHMRFFLSSRSALRRKTCCRLVACVNSVRNIWRTCKCSSKFEKP